MGKQEDLLAAVKDQDISTVLKLIGKVAKSKLIGSAKKLNFNHADSNGLSLLHYAASSDNIEIVKILIEHGATVDAMDNQGIRPLHVAARQGNARSVAHLISCGSSVNDPAYDGSTPLHMTCEPGHIEMVELLLNHGGDPTAYNCEHKTAFDIACEFGNLKVVEKLVASPQCGLLLREYKQKTKDIKRTTCLHLAAKNGNVHILRFLLEFGFDSSRQTAGGNCLHEAVTHGQIKAVKFLLDWGVDLHCRNSFNQTALDIVHGSQKLHQNEKLVRLLTDAPFQPLTVRAVRSYQCAQQQNQLSFREGDLIRVVERHSDEIWKGYLFRDSDESQQHVAYFPSSEVEVVRFSDAADDGLGPLHFPSQMSANLLSQCPVSSQQRLSQVSPRPVKPSAAPSLSTDRADRTAEWIVQSAADVVVATECGRSGSPMSSKDNISESNRSSTSSSSGSSGYLDGNSQVNASGLVCQPNRLSGQSCESGVASLWPSTNCIPVSTSRSSHSTLDWLDESDHCSGRPASVNELFQRGLKDSDVMYVWLHHLQLTDCYQLFVQAGYDMPTISRMTPEDLTAIGITQPSVRKHLTSEISRLNLTDKIPNFRSNNLLEWLQMLNLEEYHSTLVREGYTNVDRIMEITWEDLEDVGVHKLGHQKKLLLAIDRMKKLNSGGKSNDPDIPRHPDLRPPGVETSPKSVGTRLAKPGPKNQPLGPSSEVILKKEDSGRLAEASSGPQVKSVIRLPPQTPFVHPASRAALQAAHATSASPSPEVIAIHVNRPVNSRTGSVKERGGVKPDFQHVMYKSFHGNPSSQHDFAGRYVDLDGDMTPTNDRGSLSTDETIDDLGPPDNFRPPVAAKPYRRASAGGSFSGATTASDILACLPPPSHCGNVSHSPGDFHGDPHLERNLRNLDVGIAYSSAPTTPSHSALGGGSPAGTRSKKIVPQPPKRSNSIKDKLKMSAATGSQDHSFPVVPKSANSAAASQSPAPTDLMSNAAVRARHSVQGPSAEPDNPLSRVIARLEWKDDQVVRPAKPKASDACSSAAQPGSSGVDCNTLPFANENIGTIRPRNPGKPSAPHGGDVCNFQGSPGPRRSLCGSESVRGDSRLPPNTGTKKPQPAVPSKKPTSAKSEQTGTMQQKQSQSVSGAGGGGGDVFDDIDNLFQGLTKELNQMLTFDG